MAECYAPSASCMLITVDLNLLFTCVTCLSYKQSYNVYTIHEFLPYFVLHFSKQ